MKTNVTFGDLFAGGGGVTTGALSIPGVNVLWALNHDEMSIKIHEANHPETRHYHEDIRKQDEHELDPVDILWASLECTNYSNAKGGLPRDADSRTLAWELPRYIDHCRPSVIIIENVREFLAWGPLDENGRPVNREKGEDFLTWVQHIQAMGYINVDWRVLNAADYGAHTRRERLFVIFAKSGIQVRWKRATHCQSENNIAGLPRWRPVRECIDLNSHGKSIFGRSRPLAENTLRRIAGGIRKFYPELSFLMKYYGNGDSVTSIDEPCHTITTKDRHALISVEKKQFITDHVWGGRMQTVDEPLKTQLTRQTKQLITIVAKEKYQFISSYYNSSGKPESNNKSLNDPLGSIMTKDHHALVSADLFDIKMRFLTPSELARITGFHEEYFRPFKVSHKDQVKMIGNAVPVTLAAAVIEPMIQAYKKSKSRRHDRMNRRRDNRRRTRFSPGRRRPGSFLKGVVA